jgi:hypothetical protein
MVALNKERKKRKRNVRVETGSIVMIFGMSGDWEGTRGERRVL